MQQERRCAAVFKTYSWDSFVERQSRRFAEAAVGCDVFISIDETNGGVGPIPFEHVVRVTIPTEVALAGLRRDSLARFGDVSRCNWGPAQLESDVVAGPGTRLQHPVLDERRYAANTLRTARSVAQILNPRSELRRHLSRIPRTTYGPMMLRATLAQLRLAVRQQFYFARLRLLS